MAWKSHKPETLLEYLDKLPPCWLFVLGLRPKRNGARPTAALLAQRAGLPPRTFRRVAAKASWAGVKPEVVDAFHKGCGIPLFCRGHHQTLALTYIRTQMKRERPLPYLARWRYRQLGERLMGKA